MEKKIDKDHLINQLYDYLVNEVNCLKIEKDKISTKLNFYKDDKNKKLNVVKDRNKIYRIRKIFSPLDFNQEDENQNNFIDTSEIDHSIRLEEKNLQEINNKIHILSEYLQGLEENYFVADSDYTADEDEKVPFIPAFDRLVKHVKMIHPEIRINNSLTGNTSEILMNFSFLKGFQVLIDYLIFETGVYVINIEKYIDKYKILIKFDIKPKLPKDIAVFKNSKRILEEKLSKEYSVIRWKSNSIIIQALMES